MIYHTQTISLCCSSSDRTLDIATLSLGWFKFLVPNYILVSKRQMPKKIPIHMQVLKNLWNTKLNVLPHLNTGLLWKWHLQNLLLHQDLKTALSFILSSSKLRKRSADEEGRAAGATWSVGVGITQTCYQADKETAQNCWCHRMSPLAQSYITQC